MKKRVKLVITEDITGRKWYRGWELQEYRGKWVRIASGSYEEMMRMMGERGERQ